MIALPFPSDTDTSALEDQGASGCAPFSIIRDFLPQNRADGLSRHRPRLPIHDYAYNDMGQLRLGGTHIPILRLDLQIHMWDYSAHR
jgi:hypothetical protein